MRRHVIRWSMLVAWMVAIFLLSAQPHSSEVTAHVFGGLNFEARKLAHVTVFGILFVLAYRAFGGRWLPALILSVAYACLDEWHQSFVPGRTSSAGDVAIDAAGMLIAFAIIKLIERRKRTSGR